MGASERTGLADLLVAAVGNRAVARALPAPRNPAGLRAPAKPSSRRSKSGPNDFSKRRQRATEVLLIFCRTCHRLVVTTLREFC